MDRRDAIYYYCNGHIIRVLLELSFGVPLPTLLLFRKTRP
jgi:hypothetical protein